jgi:hypothetical protein
MTIMTRRFSVAIINASTVLTDDDIRPVMGPLQRQIDDDWQPIWGTGADLSFVPRGAPHPEDRWWLLVLDDSDQAGSLGYHDTTTTGSPLGKAFAGTDLKCGRKWSVTISHELLEILADPEINLMAQVSDTECYAHEVCDPVQGEELGYTVDGVTVSDFVYPNWFRPSFSGPYDHRQHCTAPLQICAGGYISVLTLGGSSPGWTLRHPEGAQLAQTTGPPEGSRRERRARSWTQWRRSAPVETSRANRR